MKWILMLLFWAGNTSFNVWVANYPFAAFSAIMAIWMAMCQVKYG